MLLSPSADVRGPIPAAELCSPPRGWPERFSQDRALNSFIGAGRLRGKRCRLTAPPPGRLFDEAASAGVLPIPGDSRANAEALHAALGWPIIKGYAVFEMAAQPGVFAALARQWNCVRGVWVDLTPRPDAHASLVLVESEIETEVGASSGPASGAECPPEAGAPTSGAPAAPGGQGSLGASTDGVLTATGERWRPSSSPKKAPSLSMLEQRERWQALASDHFFRADVSALRDQLSLHAYLEALRDTGDPTLQLIQTNAQAFAVLLDELASGPVLPRPRGGPGLSGGGTLAVRRVGTVVAVSTKPEAVRQAELHASMLGVWSARKGVKHGRIRLQLRPKGPAGPAIGWGGGALVDGGAVEAVAGEAVEGEGPICYGGEFALEAQSWSSLYEEDDVPAELFAELESDDESAAQLRCRGWWESSPYGFSLRVCSAEEVGRVLDGLPLRAAEIRAAAGPRFEKELFGTMDFEARTATMGVADRRERRLVFHAPGL